MGALRWRSVWLAGLLCAVACHSETAATTSAWQQLSPLAQRQQQLHCAMDSLQLQARHLWDGVVDQLSAQLPANMPAEERQNILAVRNRALIQMFMVYDSLSHLIQQKVEMAGRQDSLLALAMKANNAEAQTVNHALDSSLLRLQRQLPAADFLALTARLSAGLGLPCPR